MQLEKILQSQGFGSRKQCRQLIENGRVSIDGEIIDDAKANIDTAGLEFSVAGKLWPYHEKVYIVLNKPKGYECSRNTQHHASVFSLLPPQFIERGVQCVGRLDQDTTGLLLMTDDGPFLQALTHPKKHVAKRYVVTTNREVSVELIAELQQGVELRGEDGLFAADNVELIHSHQIALTIHQGVYHQVKRMLAAVGNHVDELHRAQIGAFELPHDLPEGQWTYLTAEQQLAAKSAEK